MDAKTLFHILKPHLEKMENREKKFLSQLINGSSKGIFSSRRKILTSAGVKEKLKVFRIQEMARERKEAL